MPSTATVTRTDTGLASTLRVTVARLNRRLRIERDVAIELTSGQIAVLGFLFREGDHSIGELAAGERVQPPSMTRTVTILEEGGYVERLPHPTDRRQVVVSLSEKGRETLLADRRRREAWLALRLKQLTPDERDVLRRAAPVLERLSQL